MFCENCGKEIPEGAEKCPACGKELNSNKNINFSDVANYAGQQMNKAVAEVQSKARVSIEAYKKEQDERKVHSLADVIIDPQEEQVAVIGSNYLDNMLRGGGLSKGFGILTDKRFYFKGKCYTKVAGHHKLIDNEYTVDLNDITATGFVFARRFMLFMLAILLGGGLSLFACAIGIFLISDVILILGIVAAIVLLIAYWLTKRAVYEVYFNGGVICVDVSKYGGIKEVKAFNKALRLAKDKRK